MIRRPGYIGGALGRGLRVFQSRGVKTTLAKAAAEVGSWVAFGYHRMWSQPFLLDGVKYSCLVHLYNRTWTNERAVEIPLARTFLANSTGPVLELGNVLANYGAAGHTVIDKYEIQPSVLNVDVVDYRPDERFGAIISISTLEHVGFDELPRDASKIPRALNHLRNLLLPGGQMLVTCPLSYNPHLDELVAAGSSGALSESFLLRGARGWEQVDREQALANAHMSPRGGNAIWVARFTT
jgi:hypothetical protein